MSVKNIKFGNASVPFNEVKNAWVKVNGELMYSRIQASVYAEKLHNFMVGE